MTLVSKLFVVDVGPILRSFLHVALDSLADVSEVYAASICVKPH
jgi:hypothetical protein